MNPINHVSANPTITKLNPAAPPAKSAAPADASPRGSDRLDLSGVQNYMQVLRNNDIRAEKVAEVRAQIEAGTYETDEKLDIAVDRLIDDL